MALKSINPVSGKIIEQYREDTHAEIERKIEQTHKAWEKWRETDFAAREKVLRKLASLLMKEKESLAEMMALEMGKPLQEGISEIEKSAWVCNYYAENGQSFLQDEMVKTGAEKSFVTFQPLGIVLGVMPWNFPFWQVFRFLAPTLLAGNAVLLKHASNVTGCALQIEQITQSAGLPNHAFQVLLAGSKKIKKVIAHPLVKAVTLTGSTEAGKAVAATAGEYLKKTVLELGGSDPYIILADADLDAAAKACAQSRLINNGQSCIAAKRFIVVNKVKKEFETLLVKYMAEQNFGNPRDTANTLGPMARRDLRDELHEQVQKSIRLGAKCILGGSIPEIKGKHAYYPPTVLTEVKKGMPACDEEMFGPVAAVIGVRNTREAIRMANDSVFGLGAAVFSENKAEAEKIARESLQAGCCFINNFVRSDPRLPFGGINHSGYGRELGPFGIREFVNIKTVSF